MTEHEYNVEILCINYSLETLNMERNKIINNVIRDGHDVIDVVDIETLDEAINRYDEDEFVSIREELQKTCIKFGII